MQVSAAAVSSVERLAAPGAGAISTPRPQAVPAPPPPRAEPVASTLGRLVGPFVWQYRWTLLLCVFLNSLPGFAIAAQAFVPKFLVDDVLKPPASR